MEIIRLSQKDLKKLKKYNINSEINNTESDIYIYNKNELLKLILNNELLLSKFYVLNKLFYIKEHFKLDELVLPNSLVKLSGKPSGFTMDFIKNNTNVGLILNNKNILFEDKKFILNCISKILRNIELDKDLQKLKFHLGDIHEYNFIYDNKENCIRAIDIDSAYLEGAIAPNSKFLTFNDKLWDFPNKYPLDFENDRHIPNKNTTIISYIYMYLNTFTNSYVPNLSFSKFCEVLNMMNNVGINNEILDSFYNIYLPKDNYLDYELLNSITVNQYNCFKTLQLKNVKK